MFINHPKALWKVVRHCIQVEWEQTNSIHVEDKCLQRRHDCILIFWGPFKHGRWQEKGATMLIFQYDRITFFNNLNCIIKEQEMCDHSNSINLQFPSAIASMTVTSHNRNYRPATFRRPDVDHSCYKSLLQYNEIRKTWVNILFLKVFVFSHNLRDNSFNNSVKMRVILHLDYCQ